MNEILKYTLDYLEQVVPNFKKNKTIFTCPLCGNFSCRFIGNSNRMSCSATCKRIIGDLADVVATQNKFKREEAFKLIAETLNLELPKESEIDTYLKFYQKNGFDMVPLAKNAKFPIEKDWVNKLHKAPTEWKDWLANGSNIGVKTGEKSNLTIIDIDTEIIPDVIDKIKGSPLIQKTKKGWHLFYSYDKDLPTTRINDLSIDILNNGKQCVLFPSIVENVARNFINTEEISPPSKELKEFLLSQVKSYKQSGVYTLVEEKPMALPTSDKNLDIEFTKEGNRHNFMMHFGGILRKELNMHQAKNILGLFNRYFCKPPLDYKDFNALISSLEKYTEFDEKDLAHSVLSYIKIVEDASARDVIEALGYKKQKIDKVLSYLVKEGYLIKKRRLFHIIKKVEWKDTFIADSRPINFTIPYFYDQSIIRNGDMIVIGAKQKVGKSHIALNIIRRLVNQNIKPFYISLESGNRFATIATQLGLKEGEFNWATHFTPESIELEKEAITVIDWLLPDAYAETDKLYKHFAEQLVKQGGILFIFVQLKENGKFFAENMIAMFPSIVSRYVLDDETDGTLGKFILDYIREPILKKKTSMVPCKYLWNTKELLRLDELDKGGMSNV